MAKPQEPESSIMTVLGRLIEGAAAWAQVELNLTREDAKRVLRRYFAGFGMLLLGFAILTVGFFILAQTLILVLAAYIRGNVSAGFVVSLCMFAGALVCLAAARQLFRAPARSQSALFQRLLGQSARK